MCTPDFDLASGCDSRRYEHPRQGSAMGPLLAGQWLGAGASATHVLQGLLPVTGIAAVAAVLLLILKQARSS
jgi:hypothetical protein